MTNTNKITLPGKKRSAISALLRFLRLGIHPQSFVKSSGLLRSYKENRPVDSAGNPLPWLPYSLIRILDERVTNEMRVFEYGAGYSTLYFADRVETVVSIEHVEAWVETLKTALPDNVVLEVQKKGRSYIEAPSRFSKFDLILIDGLDRSACMEAAKNSLTEQGVIIVDDSHREEIAAKILELKDFGFKALPFFGPRPTSLIETQATILYKKSNALDL